MNVALFPGHTDCDKGCWEIVAVFTTLSVAAEEIILVGAHPPLTTQRYWYPLCETDKEETVTEELVAPLISVQVDPLLILLCH